MAAYTFDLLSTPSFPVYGLDDQFDGYRWLVVWNDRERLHMVSLGHGHPEVDRGAKTQGRAAWLTVSTHLKTERRQVVAGSPRTVARSGYQTALFGALTQLADCALPSNDSAQWVVEQLNQVRWGVADERNAPEYHGPEWIEETTAVDGRRYTSMSRRIDGSWARLVDLPTVALAIVGPDSMSAFGSVVDVRARLADYN